MEHGWARFTEWAADDAAVGGNHRRSLSLASALVRVARLGTAWQPSTLMTLLLADSQDLPARVERLLRAAPAREKSGRVTPVFLASAALLPAGCLAAAMLQPATLQVVHRLLEHLIR